METEQSYDTQIHLCRTCVEKSIHKWFLKCANCGGWGEEWIATTTREWLNMVAPIIKEVLQLDTSVIIVTNGCPGCHDGNDLDYLDDLTGNDDGSNNYDC